MKYLARHLWITFRSTPDLTIHLFNMDIIRLRRKVCYGILGHLQNNSTALSLKYEPARNGTPNRRRSYHALHIWKTRIHLVGTNMEPVKY
jgi:hypothetical protein